MLRRSEAAKLVARARESAYQAPGLGNLLIDLIELLTDRFDVVTHVAVPEDSDLVLRKASQASQAAPGATISPKTAPDAPGSSKGLGRATRGVVGDL